MSVRIRPWIGLAAALLLVVGLSATAGAQTADLSGSWTLNTEKSELPQAAGGRGGGMGGGAPASLTIAIKGEEISITSPRRSREGETMQTMTFTADGKPHAVEGGMSGMGSTTVTATWAEGVLTVVQTMSFDRGGQAMTFTTTEKYSLSADGAALTVEGSRTTQRGDSTWKAVYDKK